MNVENSFLPKISHHLCLFLLLSDRESFTLNAVNDIEGFSTSQFRDGDASALGEAEISLRDEDSQDAEWHPHTVKVMKMLREEVEKNDTKVSFSEFASGAQDRRTMAG
jgi:hypothetical protein